VKPGTLSAAWSRPARQFLVVTAEDIRKMLSEMEQDQEIPSATPAGGERRRNQTGTAEIEHWIGQHCNLALDRLFDSVFMTGPGGRLLWT
jgi:hypothetical protein